ncbi:hypothetical protein ACUTAF_09175 [Pseudomonas sp. SP16.1]|uniref:hypothetical protein n=1 Tax=Pseudomonas sp. SP16.1 TaxID=3458854 RepID=UPI0040454A71
MRFDRSAFYEWPYLAGVGGLSVLLLWNEPSPSSPHAPGLDSPPTLAGYRSQHSLQKVESNCYQEQQSRCTDGCGAEDDVSSVAPAEPDLSLSILTCTDQTGLEDRRISGGTGHNLVIEVIRTDYEF